MTRTIAVIPARYGSTRLPGKPLALINGKFLIQRVWEQACRARVLDELAIATDDERIKKVMEKLGATVYMTSRSCNSGTDRVTEVAKRFEKKAGIILNIQGDEPLIDPETIDVVAIALKKDRRINVASACFPLKNESDIENTNINKVVLDKKGFALYFSKYPIPFKRDGGKKACLKHLGIYGFRRAFLLKFSSWQQTPLEQSEKLEQLRILENGFKIKMIISNRDSIGVDEQKDVERVERLLKG